MFIIFLVAFALAVGITDAVQPDAMHPVIKQHVDQWKSAHPYQTETAPTNPAQITGGSTSENPE